MKRNLVFWSWNGKLEENRLISEMEDMKRVGIGGFFIHARAGLQIGYFSDQWFEFIRFCAKYAYSIGLEVYLYDENGWPSGTSDGAVPKKSRYFCQSRLEKCASEDLMPSDEIEAEYSANGKTFFFVRRYNRDYTDLLNEAAVREFLDTTHEVYRKRLGDLFGREILGIFTDEPQMSGMGYPFTDGLFDIFEKRYGYSLREKISDIAEGEAGNCTRLDYRALISDLYEKSFFKQIGDWCRRNKLLFTGHLAAEDGLYTQIQTQGDVMPCYQHFSVPGIDSLGRKYPSAVLLKQAVSAAAQAGKKDVLCEIFGASGHASSPRDWLNILFYENMLGVNTACLHLSAYSALGRRKRDFPPTFSYHMNYFDKMTQFFSTAEKLCAAASFGKEDANILLLDPIESFFFRYREQSRRQSVHSAAYPEELKEAGIDEELSAVTVLYRMFQENLLALGFNYHLGNEKLLRETAEVEGGRLKVGSVFYDKVIIPYCLILRDETTALLARFAEAGGEVYFVGKIPRDERGGENAALRALYDGGRLLPLTFRKESMARQFDGYGWSKNFVFYAENSYRSAEALTAVGRTEGNGKIVFVRNRCGYDRIVRVSFRGREYCIRLFEAENVVLYYDGADVRVFYPLSGIEMPADEKYFPLRVWRGKAAFLRRRLDDNLLVADSCRAKLNGEELSENYVVRLNEILNKKMKAGDVLSAEYPFFVRGYEGTLSAVAEKSDYLSDISVNGEKIVPTGEWFYDRDFSVYDLSGVYREGKNILRLCYRIPEDVSAPSESAFENMENKFCETVSLENILLKGDFSVGGQKREKERLGRKYFSVTDEFIGGKKGDEGIFDCPFYRGRILYSGQFVFEENFIRAFIRIGGCYHVAEVCLNGKHFLSYGGAAEVTGTLKQGENILEIIQFTSDRNLMGPHHYFDMDSEMVSPDMYIGKKGWFDGFNLRVPQCRVPDDTFVPEKYVAEEEVDPEIVILFY